MTLAEAAVLIGRSALFDGYSPIALAATLSEFDMRCRSFAGGEVLADESDPVRAMGIVLEGFVHVYDSALTGRRNLVRIVGPGQVLGASLVKSRRTTCPGLVRAYGKGSLVTFSIARIRAAQKLGREPRFFANLGAIVSEELMEILRMSSVLRNPNIAARVLAYLHGEVDRTGSQEIRIGATEEAFASLIGVSRTALSRVLRQLVREKRLSYSRDVLKLL